MTGRAFDKLTRKPRLQARLLKIKRALGRPFRPDRIAPERPGAANLLLLGVDTLRADHLGFAGYAGGPTSPNLDRLAGQGTIFTDVTASAPWTLPSFTSALTGVMPGLHGGFLSGEIRNMDTQPPGRLNEGIITLAAHLKRQGYRTAAFYSNQFFAFGLAESFDHHQYLNLAAEDLAAVAQEWIRRNADTPFFCFVLFNDPHEPTTPAADDLAGFLPGAAALGGITDPAGLEAFARWGRDPGSHLGLLGENRSATAKGALATKRAIYDATIHQVDRVIGQMQKQLVDWRLAESTLVSVFADHGEEFLDHVDFARQWNHDPRPIRGIGHGHSHFQELLHVPWVAWGPRVPAGVRQRQAVSLCDLAPTLLDWLELPALEQPSLKGKLNSLPNPLASQLQGHSQVSDSGVERTILAEAIAFGPDLVAVRQERWKLIAHRDGRPVALFDLLGSPLEDSDLQDSNPEVVARLLEVLKVWRESGTGAGGDTSGASWEDMDDTVRQRLRDLGYSD